MTAGSGHAAPWTRTLGTAAPIGLADVNADTRLMTRQDSKFLVPVPAMIELSKRLFDTFKVLQIGARREFEYESMYFDTPDLRCYRDQVQRRRRRAKVRTRTYLDSATTFAEVKLSAARGGTTKVRVEHPFADRDRLVPESRAFVSSRLTAAGVRVDAVELEPTLLTTYRRSTLVDTGQGVRITCDASLAWSRRRAWGEHAEGAACRPDVLLLEVKSAAGRAPVIQVLHEAGFRAVTMSKYPAAFGSLGDVTGSNRWHRALRRMSARPA